MTSSDFTASELRSAQSTIELRRHAESLISRLLAEYQAFAKAQDQALHDAIDPEVRALVDKLGPLQQQANRAKGEALRRYLQLRDDIRAKVDQLCQVERARSDVERATRLANMPHCEVCGSHRLTPGGCLNCLYFTADSKPAGRKSPRTVN